MMVLMGTLNAPSCTLHSPRQAKLQQNAYVVSQRLCQNRLKMRGSVYPRRVIPLSLQGRSSNPRQAQTAWLNQRLKGSGRQVRWKLTRSSAGENSETDEYCETDDYRNENEGERKEQEVVDVVASPPSVEALTEIDSTVTVRRSSSSSPVRNQPQKSVHGREGGGGLQWVLGPLALLITGALPALWLPSPALFGGSTTAGLLALTGLDAVFNMGATAFLLMADYSAGGQSQDPSSWSKASIIPLGYKVWSFMVNLVGLVVPVALVVASWRGLLPVEPGLPVLPTAALLGPYTLLVVVQWLAEALVWQWRSPVWPVLPLVYQAYRLLQLTRGIELGVALDAPTWLVHAVKGLVAWWVFVLGMQIMWVAWLVGTIQTRYSRSG